MDSTSEVSVESTQNVLMNNIDINSLSLDKVLIHHTYFLTKASIGQIMKRISNLEIKNPKNKYQILLNEYFKSAVPKFIGEYNNLLKCSSNEEYLVKDYNLLGNLPKNMILNTSIKKNSNLYQASIGDMMTAIRQRIEFITKRDTPKFYENNQLFADAFKKMQREVRDFLVHVDEFEQGFIKTIDSAMKQKQNK